MDFRQTIRTNNRKTKLVIGTYILIMSMVGLLADVSVAPAYPSSLSQSLLALMTLEAMPYITMVVMVATLVGILVVSKFGHRLMLSGSQYKRLDGAEEGTLSSDERQVVNMVEEMAISASLGYTPKIYIMEAPEMNAFAAGWNKKNALVAVTRGLLENLTRSEVQAVIAHEVGHIIHGDSKLTLYVGILANIILTVTNIFSHFVMFFVGSRGEAANKARLLLLLLNFILPIVTQVLYLYLSRKREYMADAAAVQLTGDNVGMINALKKISGHHAQTDGKKHGVGENFRGAANIFETGDSVFSTHPSIANRIKKLGGDV